MFKALIYIRAIQKVREPAMFFVQIVMPVIYISLGVFLSQLSPPKQADNNQATLQPSLYSGHFSPSLFGLQSNLTGNSFNNFLETFTEKSVKDINNSLAYEDLEGLGLMTVFRQESAQDQFIGYFNDTAQHSIPILINTINNYYSSLYSSGPISLTSQPFRITDVPLTFDGGAFAGNLFVGITYVFIPCGFALELIYDRQVRGVPIIAR